MDQSFDGRVSRALVEVSGVVDRMSDPDGDFQVVGTNGLLLLVEASLLVYPQARLEEDGYFAVKLLQSLEKAQRQIYGIYGPFKDLANLRLHLVCPTKEAMERNLFVYDWTWKAWI